ncbi:Aladin [Hibiscus syriacus]|uniref:Aladin n=1 Tax=Hibiscus syriacus TaxID=106335 RepID=A0A6A2Y2K5_HIBSY|nr:Aladin [Hibiscus syriacus]
MPSFPQPGFVTIFEINRDLVTADTLSDAEAKETYGNLLGMVFNPVPFQSLEDPTQPPPTSNAAVSQPKGFGMITSSLKHIFLPNDIDLLPDVALQGVSWHQHKHILAFISGSNQVTVRDFEDSAGKEPCILTSESQRDVKVLEWRPNGGKSLAVACKHVSRIYKLGGICIWVASYPGNAASVRSGSASFLGALSRGIGTPIRRGLGGTSVVKWSPTGDYFFSGKFDGTFYLWETNTWTSEPWSSASGFVTGATWDPDGRMVLLAFSKSSKLGSIHFASKLPSLDAHLLPVDLPEILSLTGSQGIEKMAWDASGERLAVSYKGGDDIYKGLIAIYDTRRNPLISASLIGFIRGPGDNPKPIAFSFHNKFKQGPLLSVVNPLPCHPLITYTLCAGAVDFAVPTLCYFDPKILPWSRYLEATYLWYV